MTCFLSIHTSPTSVNFSDSLQYLMKPQASGAEVHTAGKGAQHGVAEPQVRLQWPSCGIHGGNVNRPELGGSWSQLLWLK